MFLVVDEVFADYAFSEAEGSGSTGLRKVRFPSGLRKIGEGVFYRCLYLQEAVLPDSAAISD